MKSIFKLFFGPTPENLEQKGDALMDGGSWGAAKLAYERALEKLEKQTGSSADQPKKLMGKIRSAKEALARKHLQTVLALNDGGHFDEAREMLALAMEITEDDAFLQEIQAEVDRSEALKKKAAAAVVPDIYYGLDDPDGDEDEIESSVIASDDEYFHALSGTLPETVRAAYLGYGATFKIGYLELNQGDFENAAVHLAQSMVENPQPDSYIPLELATAYTHLRRLSEARLLLQGFLAHHPEALPAYQLLCEICWEQNDFESVDDLLATVPEDLVESLAFVLLRGETRYRSGQLKQAGELYQNFLEAYGWHDAAAFELAKVHENMGNSGGAIELYREMISRCQSCHAHIDPMVKHKYAELRFEEGNFDTDVLELYLSLAREMPENAALYFDRISVIYEARGDHTESARFRAFSERAKAESD